MCDNSFVFEDKLVIRTLLEKEPHYGILKLSEEVSKENKLSIMKVIPHNGNFEQ